MYVKSFLVNAKKKKKIAKLSIVKSKVSKNTNIKVNFEQEIELRKKYFQIIQC